MLKRKREVSSSSDCVSAKIRKFETYHKEFHSWLYNQLHHCDYCGSKVLNLFKHINTDHPKAFISCEECNERVMCQDLEEHMERFHPIPLFECGPCDLPFIDYRSLQKHLETEQHITKTVQFYQETDKVSNIQPENHSQYSDPIREELFLKEVRVCIEPCPEITVSDVEAALSNEKSIDCFQLLNFDNYVELNEEQADTTENFDSESIKITNNSDSLSLKSTVEVDNTMENLSTDASMENHSPEIVVPEMEANIFQLLHFDYIELNEEQADTEENNDSESIKITNNSDYLSLKSTVEVDNTMKNPSTDASMTVNVDRYSSDQTFATPKKYLQFVVTQIVKETDRKLARFVYSEDYSGNSFLSLLTQLATDEVLLVRDHLPECLQLQRKPVDKLRDCVIDRALKMFNRKANKRQKEASRKSAATEKKAVTRVRKSRKSIVTNDNPDNAVSVATTNEESAESDVVILENPSQTQRAVLNQNSHPPPKIEESVIRREPETEHDRNTASHTSTGSYLQQVGGENCNTDTNSDGNSFIMSSPIHGDTNVPFDEYCAIKQEVLDAMLNDVKPEPIKQEACISVEFNFSNPSQPTQTNSIEPTSNTPLETVPKDMLGECSLQSPETHNSHSNCSQMSWKNCMFECNFCDKFCVLTPIIASQTTSSPGYSCEKCILSVAVNSKTINNSSIELFSGSLTEESGRQPAETMDNPVVQTSFSSPTRNSRNNSKADLTTESISSKRQTDSESVDDSEKYKSTHDSESVDDSEKYKSTHDSESVDDSEKYKSTHDSESVDDSEKYKSTHNYSDSNSYSMDSDDNVSDEDRSQHHQLSKVKSRNSGVRKNKSTLRSFQVDNNDQESSEHKSGNVQKQHNVTFFPTDSDWDSQSDENPSQHSPQPPSINFSNHSTHEESHGETDSQNSKINNIAGSNIQSENRPNVTFESMETDIMWSQDPEIEATNGYTAEQPQSMIGVVEANGNRQDETMESMDLEMDWSQMSTEEQHVENETADIRNKSHVYHGDSGQTNLVMSSSSINEDISQRLEMFEQDNAFGSLEEFSLDNFFISNMSSKSDAELDKHCSTATDSENGRELSSKENGVEEDDFDSDFDPGFPVHECEECDCEFSMFKKFNQHMIENHGITFPRPKRNEFRLNTDSRLSEKERENVENDLSSNSVREESPLNNVLVIEESNPEMKKLCDNNLEDTSKDKLSEKTEKPEEALHIDEHASVMDDLAVWANTADEIEDEMRRENEQLLQAICAPVYLPLLPNEKEEIEEHQQGMLCINAGDTILQAEGFMSQSNVVKPLTLWRRVLRDNKSRQATQQKQQREHDKQRFQNQSDRLVWSSRAEVENQLQQHLDAVENQSEMQDADSVEEGWEGCELGPSTVELETVVAQYRRDCVQQDSLVAAMGEVQSASCVVYKVDESKLTKQSAQYECHVCGEWSGDDYMKWVEHLGHHLRVLPHKKPRENSASCPICSYNVPVSDLLEHAKLHLTHSRCSQCRRLVERQKLEAHLQQHQLDQVCSVCGERYKSLAAVRQHCRHHRSGCNYCCTDCGLHFASLEKLARHVSLHHLFVEVDYAECPYCHELTEDLKNHVYTTDKCKFKCKVCLQVCSSDKEFLAHMKRHLKGMINREVTLIKAKKTFSCSHCHYQMLNKTDYDQHIATHNLYASYSKFVQKKRRATCDICDLIMPEDYLDVHKRQHKFYELCSECPRSVLKTALAEHNRSAHGPDTTCELCHETFSSTERRDHHRWAHARKINRPCGERGCPLLFCSELTRQLHFSWRHHRIEPHFLLCYHCQELIPREAAFSHLFEPPVCRYACKLCGVRHLVFEDYKQHLQQDHPDLIR